MAENTRAFRSYFTFDGKRYERTGKTPEEAAAKAALLKDKLERGEIGVSSNMTVARWAEEWIETYKRPVVGEGQFYNIRLVLEKQIVAAIGSMSLKSIRDIHLQKILNNNLGKSKSTISKLHQILRALFKQAHVSRLIPYNPAEHLTVPTGAVGKRRSITPHERKHILDLAETHSAGLWIKLLLYTGIRPGESRALDWRHIDFEKRLLLVRQSMKSGTTVVDTPKTDAGVRDIPIPEPLLADLLKVRGDPFEPVFTQPTTGRRHTKDSMHCLWKNFKRELDIVMGAQVYRNKIILSVVASDLQCYFLRHSYATDLQDAGVPINVAKYLLGHTSIEVTAHFYTDTTTTAIEAAREKINAYNANG